MKGDLLRAIKPFRSLERERERGDSYAILYRHNLQIAYEWPILRFAADANKICLATIYVQFLKSVHN